MSSTVPEFTSPAVEVAKLLPIYIVCDSSQSMQGGSAIDAVNEGLRGVIREIQRAGRIGDEIRISVLRFGSDAQVVLPLTPVSIETHVPEMHASGVTNLAVAIELLASTISADFHAIAASGGVAYRPAVFFFTDGRPTDATGHELTDHSSWQRPLHALREQPWEPRVYAYGFGDARPELLEKLVWERGVSDGVLESRVSFTGDSAAASLGRLFPALFKTVITAAEIAAGGASEDEVGRALDDAHAATSSPRDTLSAWFAANAPQ
jgi:hypothetical protein